MKRPSPQGYPSTDASGSADPCSSYGCVAGRAGVGGSRISRTVVLSYTLLHAPMLGTHRSLRNASDRVAPRREPCCVLFARTTLARVARERTPLVCGTRPGGTCPSIRCCTRDPGHFVAFGFVPASSHPMISIPVGCIRSSSHPIKDGVSVIDPSRRRPYELLLRVHVALGKTVGERPRLQR